MAGALGYSLSPLRGLRAFFHTFSACRTTSRLTRQRWLGDVSKGPHSPPMRVVVAVADVAELLAQRDCEAHSDWLAQIEEGSKTREAMPVVVLRATVGERAVPLAMKVSLRAAAMSRYPAPTVKTS